jgi:hypothetical protein
VTEGFEMEYDEYKLNEILYTQNTVIESILQTQSTNQSNTPAEDHCSGADLSRIKRHTRFQDFKALSVQIFKYCSYYLEQPKLFYSILILVNSKLLRL